MFRRSSDTRKLARPRSGFSLYAGKRTLILPKTVGFDGITSVEGMKQARTWRVLKKRIADRMFATPRWWPLLRRWHRWRDHRHLPASPHKVFCVGYLKTGTTSVGHALRQLGYRHASFQLDLNRSKEVEPILREIEHYDSFDDLPWSREQVIERVISAYPHAKFILTVRDPDRWVESAKRYRRKGVSDVEQAKRDFIARNDRVRAMLTEAGCDFIELDIATDLKWELLCPFLGRAIPDTPFPRVNTYEQHVRRYEM